jgi:hypothetical protein
LLLGQKYAEVDEDERFNMQDLNRESMENVNAGEDEKSLSNKEDSDDESQNESKYSDVSEYFLCIYFYKICSITFYYLPKSRVIPL